MNHDDIKALIPSYLHVDGMAETVALPDGLEARICLRLDDHTEPPWDRENGHGPVRRTDDVRHKAPGERVLYEGERRTGFLYDYAEAVKIARREGWGSEGDEGLSPGAKAARAAAADFEYLRKWCRDDWRYIGVCVLVIDPDGLEAYASLWGVESLGDYWRDVAAELIAEALHSLADRQCTEALRKAFL